MTSQPQILSSQGLLLLMIKSDLAIYELQARAISDFIFPNTSYRTIGPSIFLRVGPTQTSSILQALEASDPPVCTAWFLATGWFNNRSLFKFILSTSSHVVRTLMASEEIFLSDSGIFSGIRIIPENTWEHHIPEETAQSHQQEIYGSATKGDIVVIRKCLPQSFLWSFFKDSQCLPAYWNRKWRMYSAAFNYASEAEPRSLGSLAFSEVLDKALRNDNPNDPAVKAFQNSRNFASLKLNKEANQQLRDSNENVPNNENNGIIDLLSLTENHTLSWIDLYNQHLVEINDDPNDLIGPAVNDIQEVDGYDSDEEDDYTPQEANHDWVNESLLSLLRYPEIEGQKTSSSRQLVTTSIDLRTLSEKQRLIRERVKSIAPLRIIVMGTAGTGKSYLINVIRGSGSFLAVVSSRTNSSEEEPDDEDENENDENSFNSQTFVPSLPSLPTRLNEDRAINEILN
ncbi:hypothetical protein C1646_772480 [Rhizophagus diaphanus]|nr:hypothetical protein C1646_772480 [Rhizophagus diaphanus] [Rhizophagus sp. MUCL 43196]